VASPNDRALLLSLKPRFADLLLSGAKTVELRRIKPRALPGTNVIVYASSPVRAILGTCAVSDVRSGSPDEIWDLHGVLAAVNAEEYDEYFAGAKQAVAITVTNPTRLASAIPLDRLRAVAPGFHPPQSFRYLSSDDARRLVDQGPTVGRRSVAS
jgi:predicted transcriptional regulator